MKLYSAIASGLLAAAALAGQPAAGQYSPYPTTQPYAYPQQPSAAAQANTYAAPPTGYAPVQPGAAAIPPAGYAPQAYAPQAYAPVGNPLATQPAYPQNPMARVAQTPVVGGGTQLPSPTEAVAAPVAVPPTMGQPAMNQPAMATGVPAMATYPEATAGSDCGCNTPAATTGWQGYMPSATGGCVTGDCGAEGYDCGTYCAAKPRRQWFAGLYGLYMSRDNPGKATSAFIVDSPPAGNYYPQPGTDVFFLTSEADVDFAGGGEVRFGSTFGCATDPCGCLTYQPFAWELGYWGLAEDSEFGEVTDAIGGTTRIYGGINYAGLEYDRDGAGGGTYAYRTLNDYYDYQAPIDSTSTNDLRVLAVRVTQSFQVQNLELNFWRFGTPAVGAAGCGCGGGVGGGFGGGLGSGMLRRAVGGGQAACGQGCGTPAYDACGCDTYACAAPAPRRRFFINGLAGVRYLKMDETFRNAVFFSDGTDTTTYPGSMPGTGTSANQVLFHDVEVDNDLLGFQLGCSMNCLVGCRWTLFCDTNFGIYGNEIDAYQRVFSPGGGTVRFVGTGGDAAVRSSKTDVAFLGEARCGIGYQITPRCRLTSAYRAIAITGVALAPGQVSTPVNEDVWRHIDSNDSIVIHGFQGGVEFKY